METENCGKRYSSDSQTQLYVINNLNDAHHFGRNNLQTFSFCRPSRGPTSTSLT